MSGWRLNASQRSPRHRLGKSPQNWGDLGGPRTAERAGWKHIVLGALLASAGAALLPAQALADVGLERGPAAERGSLALALLSWAAAILVVVVAVAGGLRTRRQRVNPHPMSPSPAEQARENPTRPWGSRHREGVGQQPSAIGRLITTGRGLTQLGAGVLLVVGLTIAIRQLPTNPPMPPGWTLVRPPHEVSALVIQDDTVWAGGSDGLFAIDRLSATVRVPSSEQAAVRSVKALLVDHQGALWIAHGRGLARLSQGEWAQLSPADGGPVGAALALWEDRERALWVGHEQGVTRLAAGSVQHFGLADGLGHPAVDVIFQDRAGVLWVGSSSPFQGGLTRYDGRQWNAVSTDEGLAHASINGIIEDRQGARWFATGFGRQGGASRLTSDGWRTWTRSDGLAGEKVRSIFEDAEGRLWFGSEYDGLAIYTGGVWRYLTPNDGLAGWEVKVIRQDQDGAYWLATDDGVSRITRLP